MDGGARMTGPTIRFAPGLRSALTDDEAASFGSRALAARVHLTVTTSSAAAFVADAAGRGIALRNTGWDLGTVVAELLTRLEAGATDPGLRWAAGTDARAHGHLGRSVWTLCHRPAVPERAAWPEQQRCIACLRALDRIAA